MNADGSNHMPGPVVFTGSSIIAMWENLPHFFPGIAVLNTAICGSQTHEIYERLDELVISHAPSLVCYYCGSNDINNAVGAATIVGNVVKTAERVQRQLDHVGFIFLSVIKAPQKMDRWDIVEDVNAQVNHSAAKMAGLRYLDVNPVFFTREGLPRMDFYEADQLHLTPAAYSALGAYIAPHITGTLRDRSRGMGQ